MMMRLLRSSTLTAVRRTATSSSSSSSSTITSSSSSSRSSTSWKAACGPARLCSSNASRTNDNNHHHHRDPPALSPQFEPIIVLRLNTLHDNPGASPGPRRVGRGPGSSKGKTSGRGHKGQKARSGGNIPPTFEGGQTKLYKRLPKRGYTNAPHATPPVPLNLGTLQDYIDMGRFTKLNRRQHDDHGNSDDHHDDNHHDHALPLPLLTVRDLVQAGLWKPSAIQHGVKLLAHGKERFTTPIRLHVSRASQAAIDAVEAIGGHVTTVHYNRLALRALLRGKSATLLSSLSPDDDNNVDKKNYVDNVVADKNDTTTHRRQPTTTMIKQARPPPKWQPYYTSWNHRGYLNPVIQFQAWVDRQPQPQRQALQDQLDQIFEQQKQQERAEQEA